jgi:hypothetical protein
MSDALNEMGAKLCVLDVQIAADIAMVFLIIPSVTK